MGERYGGEVIDFRLRPPYRTLIDGVRYSRPEYVARRSRDCGFEPTPALHSLSVEDTLKEMDEAGVTVGVTPVRRCPEGDVPNEDVIALADEYPNRFAAFVSPNQNNLGSGADEVANLFEAHDAVKGMVVEPGKWATPRYVDDRRLYPIYDCCARLNIPVLMMGGGNAGPDSTYSSPVPIGRVAADFPTMTIVVAHGGWPWAGPMLQVALDRPNVHVSPDHYLFGFAGWRDFVDAGNGYLQDRFIFATDYPYVPLRPAVDRFAGMFNEAVLPKLFWRNAQRVLGLAN
jgi:predicted TIM-barrel fold metal-dependent hydrolase